MQIAVTHSTAPDVRVAVKSAHDELVRQLGAAPQWLFVEATVGYPADDLRRALVELGVGALHGSSSCVGVMTRAGMHSVDGRGLALFGVRDPDGAYGVGAAELGADPAEAAGLAVQRAMEAAGRPGEVPALVWMTTAPGAEEACIAGVEAVLGPEVPIVGGSSADDAIAGGWYQLTGDACHTQAVVLTVLYPSGRIASAFQSGYGPTDRRGQVTRADGRTIFEIDGEPAAEVYDAWTGGAIRSERGGGNVLAKTTLFPLGRRVGTLGGVPYYRLAHPSAVGPGGALELFAGFHPGDEVVLMTGDESSLVSRAGRVAADALAVADARADEVAGALVIFCAGCMLTVRDRMDDVVAGLRQVLGDTPFLGCFSFGEQGCFVGGENRHGNLMISVTLLLRP